MAARFPRRRFATPFVVTLAGTTALAACFVEPAPRAARPQPQPRPTAGATPTEPAPPPPQVVSNPPRPTPAPTPPPQVITNPPRPTTAPPPAVIANPPPPQPVAKATRRWSIRKAGETCEAFSNDGCPTAPNGQPVPTCNPPPPIAYACPDGMTAGDPLTVVQLAGQRECQIEYGATSCPSGARCNPPPPRKVTCPR